MYGGGAPKGERCNKVCMCACMYVCNSLHLFCYFKNVRKLFSFSLFLLTNILSPPKGLLVAPNLNLSEE